VSGLRRDEAASYAQAGVRCQERKTKKLKPETSTELAIFTGKAIEFSICPKDQVCDLEKKRRGLTPPVFVTLQRELGE
jgi:hypothetical protein